MITTIIGPNDSGHTIINAGTAGGNMQFETAGTERMRIDSSGNVGIGTTSPLRSLHIAGAGDTSLMLQTTNAVDNNEIWEIQTCNYRRFLAFYNGNRFIWELI